MAIKFKRILNLDKSLDLDKIDWIKLKDNFEIILENEKIYRVAIDKDDHELMKNLFRQKPFGRQDIDKEYISMRRKGTCRFS